MCLRLTLHLLLFALSGVLAGAATISVSLEQIPGGFRVNATEEVSSYLILQSSSDLSNFVPTALDMGVGGASWNIAGSTTDRKFFSVRQVSVYAPEDTDGDYIDDIYEIQHPVLNPLNAADAKLMVPGSALTYLEEYRALFGLGSDPPQVYSREVSSYNFGAEKSAAITREVSLFNFRGPLFSIEAMSRELSVFNGAEGPSPESIPQVYTREVSLFNFRAPHFATEAISRELTVFNGGGGPSPDPIPQVYTRETSLFNFRAQHFSIEVISREISLFNNIP